MFQPLDEEEAQIMQDIEDWKYEPIQRTPQELEKLKEKYASYARYTLKQKNNEKQ